MPTANPRINIMCEPLIFEFINDIAEEEHKSLSAIAHQLIVEALERREDIHFSRLAEQREHQPSVHSSHEKAWR